MKKTLSLLLALILVLSSVIVSVLSVSAADDNGFNQGDVVYLDISEFISWSEADPVFYVNFTDAQKPLGGQIDLSTADRSRYDPNRDLIQVEQYVYKYELKEKDEGKKVLRFWRGNESTLWNYSVELTSVNYLRGKNLVKVTGKNGVGVLDTYLSKDYKIEPVLTLSKKSAKKGESVEIAIETGKLTDELSRKAQTIKNEIYVNDRLCSQENSYTYVMEDVYSSSIEGIVEIYDKDGKMLAQGSAQSTLSNEELPLSAFSKDNIFVHGVTQNENDKDAWLLWKDYSGKKYFYLPSSLKAGDTLEFFNAYGIDAVLKINGGSYTLKKGEITKVKIDTRNAQITLDGSVYDVVFDFSSGEGAVFVNNTDTSQTGNTGLWDYLISSKENYVSASSAVTSYDGKLINEGIKKMKGRGNTSWDNAGNPKYGFNITFSSAISLASMQMCKKFSLISNFQDASLCRNRFLYDLADKINMPYASDSRFIDLYVNGEYKGAYMMAEKIDCGKNTLMSDIDEDDYLSYISGEKSDFQMCLEIGGGGADFDEIGFYANSNDVAFKYPDLTPDDENANAVIEYGKRKFSELYSALRNASTVEQYVDIDSMAKMYLLNEFSKNWDGGSSSVFFVYKQNNEGKWLWYASPVWDYDNSLGNALGVERSLMSWGVNDYTLPTGWFINRKDKSNLYRIASNNSVIQERMYKVWFEEFVPAIDIFTKQSGVSEGELYSKDIYYGYLKDQAVMNYNVSPMIVDTGWIANHSSLDAFDARYSYDSDGFINNCEIVNSQRKRYDQYSFSGEFDYMIDWTVSRAAWVSSQYIDKYNAQSHEKPTETEEKPTETQITEPDPEPVIDTQSAIAYWGFDPENKVEGEKLKEYGNADDGYKATKGEGLLTMSVDGEKLRALEWSAKEYGSNGLNIVPIMGAGSKNQWYLNGSPYIQLSGLNTKGYKNLKITMYLAGSNKAPANWKLQYKTSDGAFIDIENAVISLSADKRKILTAYFDKTELPNDLSDTDNLTIRLLCSDKTTVAGKSVDDSPTSGEIAVNHILVEGDIESLSVKLRGDADCDNSLSIVDTTYVQQHLAKLRTLSPQGYANTALDNGEVTIVVATRIQYVLANLRDEV